MTEKEYTVIIEKLTKEKALAEVEKIRGMTDDNQGAHRLEDSLYFRFIECAAAGMYEKDEFVEVAKVVQTAGYIDFKRWYA